MRWNGICVTVHSTGFAVRQIKAGGNSFPMDKFKNMAQNLGNIDISDKLQGISFPASKDDVCTQLEKNGVPSQIVDKIKSVDTSQFDSADEVISKVKGLL